MKKSRKTPVRAKFSLSFSGKTRLEVTGFNQLRLLYELKKQGVAVFDAVKKAQNRIVFSVKTKDRAKTFAICERMCYTYTVVLYTGVFAWLVGKLPRVGVALGALAVSGLMLLAQSVVSEVRVEGSVTVPKSAVLAAVRECGGYAGGKISELSGDEIRSAVNAIDGIAECSVVLDGTRLLVTVTESTAFAPPAEKRTVVSARTDGVVTRVVCREGTPLVRVGDLVRSGERLITGERFSESGDVVFSGSADGEVYGVISAHASYIMCEKTTAVEYTGKQKTRTAISLFGLRIGKTASPYERSESTVSTAVLGTLFPVRVERVTHREIRVLTLTHTQAELTAAAEQRAREELFGGEQCTVKSEIRQIADGAYEVSVYLEREGILSN